VDGAVIGNYRVVRKLGEGGMGAVYLAHHTLLGRRAAVKVLLPSLSQREEIVSRFFNEARATTSINDAGIVQIFDFGYHTDGSAFIVMELLEGEALDARLQRLGRLPAYDALRLCRQVATSLAAAHAQNIVHRDLKPENIYLVRDAEVAQGERPKILDFGIAKLAGDHPGKSKTHTGALMGTPIYMSPEQCRGAAELDHRSDIYALGCVMFHLITGAPPFDGVGMGDIIAAHLREPAPVPSSRLPGVSQGVDALILRCLAKSPDERFQTMTELAAAIGQLLPYITSPESMTVMASMPSAFTPVPTPPPPMPTPAPAPYLGGVPGLPSRPPSRPPGTPTTLGSSIGEVTPVPSPARRRTGLVLGLVAMLAVAGVVVGVAMGGGGSTPAGSAPAEPGTAAVTPDAALVATQVPDAAHLAAAPAAPADAAVEMAVDAAGAIDAAVPDAAPPDAHRHHTQPPVPKPPVPKPPVPQPPPSPGSATPTPTTPTAPAGCDRSIDFDCDGIPDKR
jgi:eukaryotic-like serine/threonine-protein kinase